MTPVHRAPKRTPYDLWYEQVGRPNRIPRRRSGVGRRSRARGGLVPGIAYYPTAFGDIPCGDRTTPPSSDSVFASSVEAWRDLVSSYAGSIPVNFLLAWIQIESCGSACSYTSYAEAGIFQLMNPDNIRQADTTLEAIHPSPPCTPGVNSFVTLQSLSQGQQVEQVASGMRYVNYARDRAHTLLAAAGQDWSEDSPDFWMMVKLYHALPGIIAPGLASAAVALGRAPQTWNEFLLGSARAYTSPIANAQWTGGFGIGGGGGGIMTILTLVGLAYIAYELTA